MIKGDQMNLVKYLNISKEVRQALAAGRPVVALESTIISHGMPYPQNVETALNVEKIVRDNGALPATICILQGKITVGADAGQIEYLGKQGLAVAKASRRDLPVLLSRQMDGATTVATTMIGADLAGIRVFATGGVGGVHRGAGTTMDISADLEELAGTSVLVVSAGCKSILDIGLTLEYLETRGVTVIGYGTREFPAFYTESSGFQIEYRLDTPEDIAAAFQVKIDCGLRGGMLVANPIPGDYAMDREYISQIIEAAVEEAGRLGIKGKNVTPFLLDKIQKLTGGKSLAANIQLVYNNAALAARIAGALSAITGA
jgi:pseudouridylate synthase